MTHRSITKWLTGMAIMVAFVASMAFAQDDKTTPTTTESTSQTSAPQDRKDKDKDRDNTAEFEKKPASDSSNADTDIAKRLNTSATVLDEIMGTPDKGIPERHS